MIFLKHKLDLTCVQNSPNASNCTGGRGMESTVPTMAHKSPSGLSWATSLNPSLVPPVLNVEDAKHTSTYRLLNLQFPLPGILFPQIISWLTSSLPLSLYRCYLSERSSLIILYKTVHRRLRVHTRTCTPHHSLSPLLCFIFSHSIYHHIILFIALPS